MKLYYYQCGETCSVKYGRQKARAAERLHTLQTIYKLRAAFVDYLFLAILCLVGGIKSNKFLGCSESCHIFQSHSLT